MFWSHTHVTQLFNKKNKNKKLVGLIYCLLALFIESSLSVVGLLIHFLLCLQQRHRRVQQC